MRLRVRSQCEVRSEARRTSLALLGAALALGTMLAGCGGSAGSADPTDSTRPTDSASSGSSSGSSYATAQAGQISLTDGWVAAVDAGTSTGQPTDMPSMDMSGMSDTGDMGEMDMSTGSATVAGESAAYATLTNTGSTADAIIGVSTPAATSATLHNNVTKGSSGTMVSVHSIPVPAGGAVTLQPGGYHVMLMGLKQDLSVGSTIAMTWRFRSGAQVTTSFPVIDVVDRPTEAE
ncbi:MAG: copper chaperone PCu(A)C [Nocardioides sp.]|uniref:copper chaperone PCu(A)C n=1 Tax=Nocardioides sp. TaxID=35761 RepID=UPI0039E5FADB